MPKRSVLPAGELPVWRLAKRQKLERLEELLQGQIATRGTGGRN